ncbi:4523_t:CDS:2, partial [Funneliformis geosporum]
QEILKLKSIDTTGRMAKKVIVSKEVTLKKTKAAECSTHIIDQIQEPQPKVLILLMNTTLIEEQLNLVY